MARGYPDSYSDALAPFQPLILAIRWGSVLIALVLIYAAHHKTRDEIASVFLVANALYRTRWPIRSESRTALAAILLELAATVALVGFSGYWQSVFFFCLVSCIVVAGFARGFTAAIPLSVATAAGIGIAAALNSQSGASRTVTAGATELVMVGLVASYARRLFGEAEQRTSHALSRLRRLSDANILLLQLNQVAQTLPASLDLEETLHSTLEQLRSMLRPDVAAVLVYDASVRRWSGTAEGVRLGVSITDAELPTPLRRIARGTPTERTTQLVDLTTAGPGFATTSRRAIYSPLIARDMLVGVAAVESRDARALGDHELALMAGMAEQAALAIDNARWFARLRTLGAEEERGRIARELHDRVAQSLAYLAFELDRISSASSVRPVTEELDGLRRDVRRVVTEVRDTLYDLRTNVTETQDLVETLQGFLDRVAERSDLEVRFEHTVQTRLPLPVEREFWRIAQEAVTNVEHHAQAHSLTVLWEVDRGLGELSIIDDGRGFPLDAGRRLDSYGLLGMRERADAIGAVLFIDSTPGKGTTVRCRLETR